MPLGQWLTASLEISVIERATRASLIATGLRERMMPVSAAASTTVPHSWHSPHRPAHFAVVQPHSVQR
jgi:hypothetical protein